MSRFRPKRWRRPRSRRAREHDARERLGVGPNVGCYEILKEVYQEGPDEWLRPLWAREAHKHGWLTSAEYWDLEPEPTGRKIPGLWMLYEQSSLLGLVKKDTNFAALDGEP